MNDKINYLDFSQALEQLKSGSKAARRAWLSTGSWVCMVPGVEGAGPEHLFGPQLPMAIVNGTRGVDIYPRLDYRTPEGRIIIGWLPQADDLFSKDWTVVL